LAVPAALSCSSGLLAQPGVLIGWSSHPPRTVERAKEDLPRPQRTLGAWLFASQAAVIAVVGVVTAVT